MPSFHYSFTQLHVCVCVLTTDELIWCKWYPSVANEETITLWNIRSWDITLLALLIAVHIATERPFCKVFHSLHSLNPFMLHVILNNTTILLAQIVHLWCTLVDFEWAAFTFSSTYLLSFSHTRNRKQQQKKATITATRLTL